MLIIVKQGLDLVKIAEGKRNKAYLCPTGYWTIGYGHVIIKNGRMLTYRTKRKNLPIHYQYITDEECEELLLKDIIPYAIKVLKVCKKPINKHELAALTSLAFNIGVNAFKRSSLLRYIRSTDDYDNERINYLFSMWKYGGGKVLKGLVLRRKAEAKLFIKPVIDVLPEKIHYSLTGFFASVINDKNNNRIKQ